MLNIRFKKVTIHHFLSFDHAEIDLTDKGYCAVSGINKNPKDLAKSNGSGKSTIFNAVSYALVGETLQGLSSNLPNIYFNDGCYVKLEFDVDGHKYIIQRSKDDTTYGTNLKIYVDDVDKSGKGIRESQAILDQLLPELTSELLGSVIMIGQGMPMKFTSNTPSGRKAVLEHLSQSDFMIQDLKNRVSLRNANLSERLRQVEDDILALQSKLGVYTQQLEKANTELAGFNSSSDFDKQLEELAEKESKLNSELGSLDVDSKALVEEIEKLNPTLMSTLKEKSDYAEKFLAEHTEVLKELQTKKSDVLAKKYAAEQELNRLNSIQDVCPTCGQKIPGAIKPDTTPTKKLIESLSTNLALVNEEINQDNEAYNNVVQELNNKYDIKVAELNKTILDLKSKLGYIQSNIALKSSELQSTKVEVTTVTKNKEFFEYNKNKTIETIQSLNSKINTGNDSLKELTTSKDEINAHLDVIRKMNTIVSRDFRGFLLKNVIEYIGTKAKEYTAKIFGCDEIEFVLDGNDIGISFCGKDYENLSGGEKQKLDLVVQFAIRDFMCQYLQFSSNILVLDEITDALDSESCDKVVSFITNELNDVESVFIISHHSDELALPVDSSIVIVKNEEGISSIL